MTARAWSVTVGGGGAMAGRIRVSAFINDIIYLRTLQPAPRPPPGEYGGLPPGLAAYMVIPPSMVMACPVMNDASSLAR